MPRAELLPFHAPMASVAHIPFAAPSAPSADAIVLRRRARS